MVKRNHVEEILSIRLRNEVNPRWGGALLQLGALETVLKSASDLPPEIVRYFPIAMVATIESYFRSAIKELIDLGSPFSENASNFDKAKDLTPDFKTVLAIQGKTITIGDLISHILPFKSIEDIDRNLTTIIGESFLEKLKSTSDRWAVEIEREPSKPIIENPSEVFRDVKETFRLRHIYCHELGLLENVNVELIKRCFANSSLFLKASDQLIWNLVAPNSPLTQSAMNMKAFEDLKEADRELEDLCSNFISFLDSEEKQEFVETQKLWSTFRDQAASSQANRWGRGGTIWPTLNANNARTLTRLRIEELKREFERVKKDRNPILRETH